MGSEIATAQASLGSGGRLLRHYFTYMAGVLMQKLGAFVLIPLYTAMLTAADYGVIELLATVVTLASLFVAFGVPSALNKCFHRDCRDEADREQLLGTCLLFTIPISLGVAAAAFLLDEKLAALLFGRPDWAPHLRLALLWLALLQTATIPMELLRTLGRAGSYIACSALQLVVQVAVSVVLLVVFELGLTALLLANIAGYAAIQIVTLPLLLRHSRFSFSWRHLEPLAAFGLVLIPSAACGWVMNLSDRFFLQRLAGETELGLYALGYKFGMLVEIALVMPFQRAWNPFFFGIADRPEAPRVLSRVLTYYVALIALGVGLMSVCGAPLVRLAAHPPFHAAAQVIPWIAASYGLSGVVMCLSTGLIVSGRMRFVAAIAIVGAVINLILNFLLIPPLGMTGAALATCLTFGTTCVLTVGAVTRWYPVPVEPVRLAKAVGSVAALCAVAAMIHIENAGLEIVARSAVLVALPLALLAVGFFEAGERQSIRAAAVRLTHSAHLLRVP